MARPDPVVQIYEGLLRALPRFGLHKLSMNDISREAGLSRGTLYRYFSSKDELLSGMGQWIADENRRRLNEAIEADPAIERRIAIVLAHSDAFRAERQHLARLIEVEPEFVMGWWREHYTEILSATRDAIAPVFRSPETGRIQTRRLDSAAEAILRMGLSFLFLPRQPQWSTKTAEGIQPLLGPLFEGAGSG